MTPLDGADCAYPSRRDTGEHGGKVLDRSPAVRMTLCDAHHAHYLAEFGARPAFEPSPAQREAAARVSGWLA